MRATTIFTTGVAGSGKSYVRCARFLVDEFIPNKTGVHISNFPVNVDAIVQHFRDKKGYNDDECERVRERIKVIPHERTEEWRLGTNPLNRHPSDYFRDPELCGLPAVPSEADPSVMVADLSRCHIAIDEIHNWAGQHTPKPVIAQWQAWLGELRHCGATFEMLSQDHVKISPSLRNEASLRYEVVDGSIKVDPVFLISYYDWWQLKAMLTGKYRATSWLEEVAKVGARREQAVKSWAFPRDPYYFRFYDSHTAAITTGQAGEEEPLEYQKYNRRRLVWWFLERNGDKLAKRGLMVLAPFWLLALLVVVWWVHPGGLSGAMMEVPKWCKSIIKRPGIVQADGTTLTGEELQSSNAKSKGVEGLAGKVFGGEAAAVPGPAVAVSVITCLGPDYLVFDNGLAYGVRDEIDAGSYAGRVLESIDFAGGVVRLDDGTTLRFGLRGSERVASAKSERGVPGSVRPAEHSKR